MTRKKLVNVRKQERPYERRYRDAVNEIGGMMRKCEHRMEKGWPDNYAPPGYWMEFKWIPFFSDASVSFWRHFDEQQKVMLRDLSLRGAQCYVVIFWDMGLKYGKRVQTIEYLAARQFERFDHTLILPFADPIEEIRSHVATHWRVEREGPKTTLVKTAHSKAQLDRSAHPLIRGSS